MDELLAGWPVTIKDMSIRCEKGDCPNPRCDGNGTMVIRAAYLLTPGELMEWIRKHAEAGND
jgi:hypothetical protein